MKPLYQNNLPQYNPLGTIKMTAAVQELNAKVEAQAAEIAALKAAP